MIKTFSVGKFSYEEINNGDFLRLCLDAISDGVNRNSSFFLREGFEDGIKTMHNKPILCYFNKDLGDAEEHNSEMWLSSRGELYTSYLGENERCVGVIPESAEIRVEEKNGKSWIVIDGGVIWTEYNYELTKLLKSQKRKKVSVEVEVLESYEENGIEYIQKWKFLGVTILGKFKDGSLVEEGIEGAKLWLKDLPETVQFKEYSARLSFALSNKNDILSKYGIKEKKKDFLTMNQYRTQIRVLLDEETFIEGDCRYCSYDLVDIYFEYGKILIYKFREERYFFLDYSVKDNVVSLNFDTMVEAEQKFVEKFTAPQKRQIGSLFSVGETEVNIEKTGRSVSEKEENMKKFIESAKDSGFAFIGLFGDKLRFVKTCPVGEDELSNVSKFSIFEVEKEKCGDEFKSEDFAELEMKDKFDEDPLDEDEQDDKRKRDDEEDDEEDGKEKLKAEKEDFEKEKEDMAKEKEDMAKEVKTLKEKLKKAENELFTFKKSKFIEEAECFVNEDDELSIEDRASLMSLIEKDSVSNMVQFTKEVIYFKYMKTDKVKKGKFSYSVEKKNKEQEVDRLKLV